MKTQPPSVPFVPQYDIVDLSVAQRAGLVRRTSISRVPPAHTVVPQVGRRLASEFETVSAGDLKDILTDAGFATSIERFAGEGGHPLCHSDSPHRAQHDGLPNDATSQVHGGSGRPPPGTTKSAA